MRCSIFEPRIFRCKYTQNIWYHGCFHLKNFTLSFFLPNFDGGCAFSCLEISWRRWFTANCFNTLTICVMADSVITLSSLRRLLQANRSIRRFDQSVALSPELLAGLVDLARYTASGRNVQMLRYRLVYSPQECSRVFPLLGWAGYLRDWAGPDPCERPAAYIVQCMDTRLGTGCLCDDGLQLEAITLGAATQGIGCCIIKSFDKQAMSAVLSLADYLEPHYVVALGYPDEKVVIEDMQPGLDADFKYYRTPDGVHHVPKRPLSDILL